MRDWFGCYPYCPSASTVCPHHLLLFIFSHEVEFHGCLPIRSETWELTGCKGLGLLSYTTNLEVYARDTCWIHTAKNALLHMSIKITPMCSYAQSSIPTTATAISATAECERHRHHRERAHVYATFVS